MKAGEGSKSAAEKGEWQEILAGVFSEEMLGVRKKGTTVERWLFNGAFPLSQGSPGAS